MRLRTLLLVCGAAVAAFAAESGNDLFQKGLAEERANGDLRAAIAIYQRIATMQGVERKLAAESLYRMAECQQALGNTEARKTYERILRDFADQREVAGRAGARLAVVENRRASINSGLSLTRVWVPPSVNIRIGSFSSDGRFVSYAEHYTGSELAVRDLITGETRHVTHNRESGSSRDYGSMSVISPDRKKIAFTWTTPGHGSQLRVIDWDGSNQKTLYSNSERYSVPAAWSIDGREILAVVSSSSAHTRQLAWMPLTGGVPRVLKTFAWQGLGDLQALSPDGKYIAYDLATDDGKRRAIYVLASDGSSESAMTDGSATDEVFGWMPDGKSLLFATDRTGVRELRALPVHEGKKPGESYLIKPDLGRMEPVGVSKTGSLLLARSMSEGQVYTASVDWSTGKLTTPTPLARGVVAEAGAGWSPDGTQVAYLARRGTERDGASRFIVVRSMETGQEREITPKGLRVTINGYPGWSPDGKSYLVTGIDLKGRNGVYGIDLVTGDARALVQREVTVNQPQWLPDGKHLLYVLTEGRGVFIRNVETGADREINLGVPEATRVTVAASPDGLQLAFTVRVQDHYGAVYVMPLAGGASRLVYGSPGGSQNVYVQGWSPDSRRIILRQLTANGQNAVSSTHWIAADGGELHPIETSLQSLRFHPDGSRSSPGKRNCVASCGSCKT
jgi:Tol biopolymer transport system component